MAQLTGIDALRAQLAGQVIDEFNAGHDTARSVWNGGLDRNPALITRCIGPTDVAAAITFGRERGLPIAVRGGAHGFWGAAAPEGGLVIDLGELRGVSVDPGRRRAWCSGGATVADLDAATQRHGLAVTAGTVSHAGVGGLTLGGGFGWLVHKAGLTADNLISAEVVTADGRTVGVSPDEHPDLFWALRGGGGTIGVVTGFEFRLHEVGPLVYLGMFFWGLEHGAEVLRLGREVATALPRNAGCLLAAGLTAPPAPFVPARYRGIPGYALLVAGFGSAPEHDRVIDPIREAAPPPLFEFVTPLPYLELQRILNEAAPWGIHAYEKSLYLQQLSDETIAVLTKHVPGKSSPMSFIPIFSLGGAFADTGEQDTAFGGSRATRFVVNVAALAPDAGLLATDRTWAHSVWRAMLPQAGTDGYVSVPDGVLTHGTAGASASHGPAKHQRLAQVKARYDPDNVFRMNAERGPAAQPAAGGSTRSGQL